MESLKHSPLATRRAAGEAVQEAAKTAADTTTHDVAGKATERCLVQAGVTIAVVLSNAAN